MSNILKTYMIKKTKKNVKNMSQVELNMKYEKALTVTDLDDVIDGFENRQKWTYKIDSIEDLEIIPNGIELAMGVQEYDEHLNCLDKADEIRAFFTPKFVWGHIAQFLGIPNRVYEHYQNFLKLNKEDFDACREHESEVLKILMNHRINDPNKSDSFITVFKDKWFGTYPRVIHSKIYYPYRDSEMLLTMMNGFKSINQRYGTTRNYQFRKAFISPYKSRLFFGNTITKTPTVRNEETESGLVIENSECKAASFNFQTYVMRLSCLNGVVSRFNNKDLSVQHYLRNFERNVQKAFTTALELEDKYSKEYHDTIKYDNKISDNWADLLELPSEYLKMQPAEKKELIDIAQTEGYDFTPNKIMQAITYKQSHKTFDDNTFDRLNEKANIVMNKMPAIQNWKPARLAN